MNFALLDATKAKAIINAAVFDWQAQCRDYRLGDHWQAGRGWFGPGPQYGESGFSDIEPRLGAAFVSQNEIGKAVDTQVGAVTGREPKWGWTAREAMPDGEAELSAWRDKYGPLIADVDALLTEWWDKRNLHGVFQELQDTLETEARAGLRLFVPPDELNSNNEVKKGNLAASLNCLYVEVTSTDQARVYLDRESMKSVGLYFFREQEDVNGVVSSVDRVEVTYLDDAGKTVRRVVGAATKEEPNAATQAAAPFDLNGNLWHFQIEKTLRGVPVRFISEQVVANQKLLNFARTVMRRNLADNGWLEEFLINTQLPGTFEEVTDANDVTTKRFVPAPITRGPGQIRDIKAQTVTQTDEAGKVTTNVLPADVKWRPPIDPATSIAVAKDAERAIARETHQEHLLQTGSDANLSGEYLKQKRANFVMNCAQSATLINEAGRWLLETALLAAVGFSQEDNPYAELRPVFECRIDAGPLSADEQRELAVLVEKSLLSRESAMARGGIDDVDAENARIDSESAGNIAAQRIRVETATMAGVPNETIWQSVLMFDDEMMLETTRAKKAAEVVAFIGPGEIEGGEL